RRREHLLLDDVGGFAERAHEQRRVLEKRSADLAVSVPLDHATADAEDMLVERDTLGQDVFRAARRAQTSHGALRVSRGPRARKSRAKTELHRRVRLASFRPVRAVPKALTKPAHRFRLLPMHAATLSRESRFRGMRKFHLAVPLLLLSVSCSTFT